MSTFNVIYACFIGDGYAEVEPPADPEYAAAVGADGAGYWYTPRNSEVGCPSCDQSGRIEYTDGAGRERSRDCTCCGGSGLVTGEPFTVTRYTFANEDTAARAYAECGDVVAAKVMRRRAEQAKKENR
jgi:hypothetical protein